MTTTAEVQLPPYIMPKPRMGDIVYWTASLNDQGYCAALVNKVGLRTVDLNVLMPKNQQLIFKSGVHHRDDPDNKTRNQDPTWYEGVWWERDSPRSKDKA